jgi:MATE family multidrug resistance protein
MPAHAATPRFADEVSSSARLAAPMAAGHLSHGLVGVVDTVVAGHHGTTTLAAVAVGTALFWLPMMMPMGMLMALPPSVSELDGAGRREEIGPLWRQALWLALALGLLLFALMTVLPMVLAPMGIAAGIIPGATNFTHAIRWGIPAFTLYLAMRYLSDGLHWSLPTMLLGFGGLLLLAPIGYVLTNGLFGFPEMGAAGLGWASAAMFWLQMLAFAYYLSRSPRFADLKLYAGFERPDWRVLRRLLGTGLPIGVTISMEGSLFIVTALLIGRLGELPVAAHQIAINVATLSFMIPFGIAEATTVRVGHALGRGDRAGIRRAAFAGLALVLCAQAISATVMLTANHAIAGLYTADARVAALAASLLLYAALFQFPDGVQVLSAGALRGLKDTRMPMLLALLAYWCVGIPVGAGLGLGLGGFTPALGPRGMWVGLTAGLSVAAFLLARRFLRSSLRVPISRQTPAAPSVTMTEGG